MTAATCPAIAGPETGDRHLAVSTLIDDALGIVKTKHLPHADSWSRQQIVDMPVQFLGRRQMPPDARYEIAQRASCIAVKPRGKDELAETADPHANRPRHLDQQLVGALARFRTSCRRRDW